MPDLVTTIGDASSDSYASEAEFTAYGAAVGWTLTGGDTDRANLRRATMVLDREYRFRGYRQYQAQALQWPRVDVGYVNNWHVDADTVPRDVKDAQCEIAYLIQEGLDVFATITQSTTKQKVGPIEVTMAPMGQPRLVAVEGLLGPYTTIGAGQTRMARA